MLSNELCERRFDFFWGINRTEYEYDFGDGVITTTQEGYVEHLYADAGTYRLGLRVRDDKGLWSEKVFYDLVVLANQAPIARMSIDVFDATAPGRAGIEVWRTSSDSDGFITEYEYNFGDGTIFLDNDGYEQHSYEIAGNYTIKVRVKDNKGLWSLPVEQTIAIVEGQKPIAINTIFSADTYAPARVLMSAFNASYDLDGQITDVEYIFGDGESVQVPIAQAFVEHTYQVAGNYIIQTRVRDNDGQWSDYSANSIEVRQSVAPVVGNIPVYGDRNRPAPTTLGFAPHEVTTTNHYPLTYVFDFGDGTVIDNAGNGYLEHTFQSPGDYEVNVTVKDSRNQSTTKAVQVTIKENQPPTLMGLNIYGNFVEPAPLAVRFDMFGQIVEEYGKVASILYEFGDGSASTSFAQVEHVYESPGTYLVVVTVTDDQGAIARISRQVVINANQPPVALALKVFKGDSPLAPVTVGVAAYESFQDLDGFITSYVYDFGDGRVEATANGYLEHVYTSSGSYILKVIAFDNKGASVQAISSVSVRTNSAPIAGFTLPKQTIGAYEVFTLDAVTGSSDPDGDQVTYSWDFGDGQTSSFEYPSHYYGNEGNYTIKLTIRDIFGETSQFEQQIEVVAPAASVPVPKIALESYPTGELWASAEGSFSTDGTALTYLWNFGDGATSSLKVAQHEYSEAGTYTISLTVTNEAQLTQTLSRLVTFAEPLVSKSEFSPGDIEFMDGLSPNQFNPISKVLSLRVTEEVGVRGDLILSLNGVEVDLEHVEGETDQYRALITSREGLNTIEILGADNLGRLLEKRIEYYAGSKSVTVNLQNQDGQPVAGVSLDFILPSQKGEDQKIFSYAPAQSSSLVISNVPRENLILKSSSGPLIIERLGREQAEIVAKEIPWQTPSETPNDDFSAGVEGWRLKGSAQILTYPNEKKSLRVLATGDYAEISKTIVAGENDLAILSVLRASSQDDDIIVLSARTESENLEFKAFRAKDLKSRLQSGWRFSLPLSSSESNEIVVRIYPNAVVTNGGLWQFLKAFAQGEPASIELPPLIRTILNVDISLIGYSRVNPPDNQDVPSGGALTTTPTPLAAFSIGPDFKCPEGKNRLFAGLVGGTAATSGLYQSNVGDEIQLPSTGSTACANFIHVTPNSRIKLAPNKEAKIAGLLITQTNLGRALAKPTVTTLSSNSSQIQILNNKLGNRPLFVLSEPGGLTEDGGAVDLEIVFYQGEAQEFSANEINCQDTDNFLCFNVANNLPVLVSTNNLEDSGFNHRRYDGTRKGVGERNLRFQTLYGGDHWAHPTLAKFLRDLKKEVEVGDISRANAGLFNPHRGHDNGLEMDFKSPNHGYNRRRYQDFWKRLEDLREIFPDDGFNEAGQITGFSLEEVGFSISNLNSQDTDGVKSSDARRYLEARCVNEAPVPAKFYSDHETHWHLTLKPEKVVREAIPTTLSFEGISDANGMYSNSFMISGELPEQSVVDVVEIQADGSRKLVWASSDLNNSLVTNDFNTTSFKVDFVESENRLTLSVRSERVEEVARSHEFIVSQKTGESCKEHVLKLRVNGCKNESKGWPAELGYFLKSGAFVSDASEVHEGAIITQGVSVCGDSLVGDNVILAGNLRVESSSIQTKDMTSFYDGNLSSASEPSYIKSSQIQSNVSSFNSFKAINTDIVGEDSTTVIINRSQLTGSSPAGNKVFGRAEFIDATVENSVVSGGTAQVPSQAYLRIVGSIYHAKAWGYGYIEGILMNGATFDGAYYETIDGTRTSHIGDTGVIRDVGTKYRGINWARGLMELGCNTDTLNGSYMEIGTVCTTGGTMRGVSRLEAGILFGSLNNQTMRLRNGQIEIVDSNTANGVPLSPIYTSPEPGDLP